MDKPFLAPPGLAFRTRASTCHSRNLPGALLEVASGWPLAGPRRSKSRTARAQRRPGVGA
eukprot:8900843-Lingulodinium_polyedra.AAC.1